MCNENEQVEQEQVVDLDEILDGMADEVAELAILMGVTSEEVRNADHSAMAQASVHNEFERRGGKGRLDSGELSTAIDQRVAERLESLNL